VDYVLNSYLLLLGAITFEVIGTLLLPASQGFNKLVPSVLVVGSYGASFYFLSIVVQKLPLAIVYASWAGLGVFSIALLSAIFYQQTLNWQTVLGLFLIVIGVTLVNVFKATS
jgi:small multidrug resistance pump